MPIAGQLGMDIIHYSMIMILAMGVGIFVPPIGIGFTVSCTVSESRLGASSKAMLPYLAVLILGVLVVAFVPAVTLGVPHLRGDGERLPRAKGCACCPGARGKMR